MSARRTPSRGRAGAAIALIAAATALLACRTLVWDVGTKVRARDADVAAALGDTMSTSPAELAASDLPAVPYPRALRPCCAFGSDLKVAVGRLPVPGVELGNLIDPDGLGPHRFDNGFISFSSVDPRGVIDLEHNGLVYTCRGGFIDTAHVRDNADATAALVSALGRSLETGGTIEIPPQGAAMRVVLRPVPSAAIARYGRTQLAVHMAEWTAFQLSIWHEIATFYGYSALAEWPEKISAFSPEDLYSNQIGVRLAGALALGARAHSDLEYGLYMDAWLHRTLERLRAVPLEDSRAAMTALDGAWWDSTKRVPDWTLVTRRDFETGPRLHPWRLEDAHAGSRGAIAPLARCRDAGPPLVLQVPDGFAGARFRDWVRVEFDVADRLVEGGLPLPRAPDRLLTQDDFPFLIEQIRAANAAQFGAGADAP